MPKSILIVDDETGITLPLASFFQHQGYQVFRAFYGDQALEQLERNLPDLVILDLQMPGVDGIAVLEKIREKHPQTKVLVVTGYADTYQGEFERLRPSAVRTKPVQLEELSRTVENLLEERNPAAAVPAKGRREPSEIRMLIIEGDRETYERVLLPRLGAQKEKGSFQVAHAGNPKEAFEQVEQFQPCLILMNTMRLPIGMEGGQLASNLLKSSRVPAEVILYSLPSKIHSPDEENQLTRLEEAVKRFLKGWAHAPQ